MTLNQQVQLNDKLDQLNKDIFTFKLEEKKDDDKIKISTSIANS